MCVRENEHASVCVCVFACAYIFMKICLYVNDRLAVLISSLHSQLLASRRRRSGNSYKRHIHMRIVLMCVYVCNYVSVYTYKYLRMNYITYVCVSRIVCVCVNLIVLSPHPRCNHQTSITNGTCYHSS